MRQLLREPYADMLIFVFAYIACFAPLMILNDLMFRVELPWTVTWVIWGAMFAPAVIATLWARLTTVPDVTRLTVLYSGALVLILVAIEATFALTVMNVAFVPHDLTLVVIADVVLCLSILRIFKRPSHI